VEGPLLLIKLEFMDPFSAFLMLSGIIQFLYYALVTNFSFNPFLAR